MLGFAAEAEGETSVERFAASAVLVGVSEGRAGGGWRLATGLREAHPEEKYTPRTHRAPRTQRGNERAFERRKRLLQNCERKRCFSGLAPAESGSNEIFKGLPAS